MRRPAIPNLAPAFCERVFDDPEFAAAVVTRGEGDVAAVGMNGNSLYCFGDRARLSGLASTHRGQP